MNISKEKQELFKRLLKAERRHNRESTTDEPFMPPEFKNKQTFFDYRLWRSEYTAPLHNEMIEAGRMHAAKLAHA